MGEKGRGHRKGGRMDSRSIKKISVGKGGECQVILRWLEIREKKDWDL